MIWSRCLEHREGGNMYRILVTNHEVERYLGGTAVSILGPMVKVIKTLF
jgi:hypothetical protein